MQEAGLNFFFETKVLIQYRATEPIFDVLTEVFISIHFFLNVTSFKTKNYY